MPFLIAAIVLVGVLCIIDLLLTVAVIRKLREHTTKLSNVAQGPSFLEAGSKLGEINGTSTIGEEITNEFFSDPTVVALFAVECPGCREHVPELVTEVTRMGYERRHVLAVVSGGGPEADGAEPFVEELEGSATVVTEPAGGSISQAFSANTFPGFYLVDKGGVVIAGVGRVAELPTPAPA